MRQALETHFQKLTFEIPAGSTDRLVSFIQLLEKWNKVYNLTAVRDPRQMVTRHILDSLVVMPYLHGTRILDVGSGAGLPGIPLAIVQPHRHFVLLDSNSKKTRFMSQAIAELGLDNVKVRHMRIEEFHDERGFDTVISRAFSSVNEMLEGIRKLVKPDGVVLAMKGAYPLAELENLPGDFRLEKVVALQVPGLDADRHLVIVRPRHAA